MPGFNRTGPFGYGPMSGKGMGPCGRGFGRTPLYSQAAYEYSREDEISNLKTRKEILERDLKNIEERIKQLENKE